MLHTITTITEDLETLIKDDPVRPEIPVSQRVNDNSRIYMLKDGDNTRAVTCVKFLEKLCKCFVCICFCVIFSPISVIVNACSQLEHATRDKLECGDDDVSRCEGSIFSNL
jgi:hypothetical protein